MASTSVQQRSLRPTHYPTLRFAPGQVLNSDHKCEQSRPEVDLRLAAPCAHPASASWCVRPSCHASAHQGELRLSTRTSSPLASTSRTAPTQQSLWWQDPTSRGKETCPLRAPSDSSVATARPLEEDFTCRRPTIVMPPASATPWAAAASAAAQKQVTSKEATSKEAQTTSPEPSAVAWKTLAGQKRTTQTPTGALQPPRSGEGNAAPSKEAISKAAASKEAGASPTQSSETAPTSPKQKKASPAGEGRTPPRRETAELSDADLSDGSSRGEASKEAHNTEMQLDSESEYPELSAGQRAAQRSARALPAVAEEESTMCSGGKANARAPKGAAHAPPPPLNQLEAEQAVVQARFSAMTAKAAATSRVAAGIVPPDQYRGLTRTAMLVEEQSPATATRPTALRP